MSRPRLERSVATLIVSCGLSLVWCGQSRDDDQRRQDAGRGSAAASRDARSGGAPRDEALPAKARETPSDAGSRDASTAREVDAEARTAATGDGAAPTKTADAVPRIDVPTGRPTVENDTAPAAEPGATTPTNATKTEEIPSEAVEPGAGDLTSLLQKVYRDVRSFEADFEQTYRNRLLDQTRESKGHVWLQPPSKMRWEYAPPSKNLIVADGRTLFVYEPEPNQVVKMPVSGSELPSVMAFLTGGRSLTEDYHVEEIHADTLGPRGQAGLELRPKKASSVVSRVVLVVARKTGTVERTVLVEPEGNTNTFVWSKVKTNVAIADRQFAFTPPSGARVVER